MRIKIGNLLLLQGAFIIAGAALATAIGGYDGGDLSSVLAILALAGFAVTAASMWSTDVFRNPKR